MEAAASKLEAFQELYAQFRAGSAAKAGAMAPPETSPQLPVRPGSAGPRPAATKQRKAKTPSTYKPVGEHGELQGVQRLLVELETKDQLLANLQTQLSHVQRQVHLQEAREDETRAALQRQVCWGCTLRHGLLGRAGRG
jgi:hypothetical protein